MKNLKIKTCIARSSFAAAAVGVPGAFAAHGDIPVLTGIWANMIYRLAKHSECPMDMATAARIAGSIAVSMAAMSAGVKAANSYFAYTGVGTLPAIVANAGANGVGTWLVGRACADVMVEKDLERMAEKVIKIVVGVMTGKGGMGGGDMMRFK